MQTFLTDSDYYRRKAKGAAEERQRYLDEVIQRQRDSWDMYLNDPKELANEAWTLETFGLDLHRKKHPKRRKMRARAGRPSKRAVALAKQRKPLKHTHKSKKKHKSHKHPA
jgi:hypothetical protein